MPKFCLVFGGVFVLSQWVGSALAGNTHFDSFTTKYCVSCHGEHEAIEGDINLAEQSVDRLGQDADLVRLIIDALDQRDMPPEDAPQPSDEERDQLLADLRPILHKAAEFETSAARAPIRRMNRFQYNNAVVDLFQLNCVVFTLPERAMRIHRDYFQPETGKMPDLVAVGNRPLGKSQLIEPRLAGVAAFPQDLRAEHGYDNQADHLSLSPLLMDQLLKLGHSITQSPDFTPKRVGIWDSFFSEPASDQNLRTEVRERLTQFLTRAFRRPVEEPLVDRYTDFVLATIAGGAQFTDAMKAAAAATISSPRFIYLYDRRSEDPSPQMVDDLELATRMSLLLWGSLPDDTLLSLATEQQLRRRRCAE